MVSVAEVAERLNIPASTGREYVKRFKPFFPAKKVLGSRFPKYADIVLEIMQEIVQGYKKQLSTDEIFSILQEKYPIDAGILARQQQHAQNVPNQNDDLITTTSSTPQTSLDIYTKMQATQFQVLQQMTHVLENNNKLMERLIGLLESQQQLSESRPVTKLEQKQDEMSVRSEKVHVQRKRHQKPSKQPKKLERVKPQRNGFFSFLKGK